MNSLIKDKVVPRSLFTSFFIPLLIATLPFAAVLRLNPASAQQIVPNNDGTMTIVTKDGTTFNIDGGQLSGDGKNLFHSFQEFGLDAGQIANFLSNPNIQNILGRINGGNASIINGLIQVTGGNSNLFLMNPSGIIFGNNASLNVPGDFSATTATGIGFGSGWFNAVGTNDYLNLVGNPDSFNFANAESGIILNAGDLKVTNDSNISLTGGAVINTGTIETEGGNITVAAIPGTNRVRISQEGQLLALEVAIPQNAEGEALPIRVVDLPNLLRGLPVGIDTGLEIAANDDVAIAGSNTVIPDESGTTIVSGTVDASSSQSGNLGGEVNILGEQVSLIDADIDASGDLGGGKVLVGGDKKGEGTVPNAEVTIVDSNSAIKADGLQNSDGGEVIVWADKKTEFHGNISATSKSGVGDGGFVEVSGQEDLIVTGTIDVSSLQGNPGTILFDPHNIIILDGSGSPGHSFQSGTFFIYETALEGIAGDANVILEARNSIVIKDLTDNNLTLASKVNNSSGHDGITFKAGGRFTMSQDDAIRSPGRNLTIHGATIHAGILDTSLGNNGNAGDINLRSTSGNITVNRLQANSLASDGNADLTLGTGRGGAITVHSAGIFEATGFRNDILENPQSIETTGQAGSGPIAIRARSIDIPNGAISSFTNSDVESSLTSDPAEGTPPQEGTGLTSLTATSAHIVIGGINLQGDLDLSSPTTFQVTRGFSISEGDTTLYAIRGKNLNFDVPNIVVPAETIIQGSIFLAQDTLISTDSPANSNLTIDAEINSIEEGKSSLGVQGNPTFEKAIGEFNRLSSLEVSGTTIINGSSIKTTGDQTYNGAVTLGVNRTDSITLDGADITFNGAVELGTDTILDGTNVTFKDRVDATQGREAGLTVNASKITRFGDEPSDRVGGNNPLASLTTEAPGTTVINTDLIKTDGDQTYNDAVELGAETTTLDGTNVTFNNILDEAQGKEAGLTVNASGNTSFGDGVGNDNVGGNNPLEFLTTDGNEEASSTTSTTVINTDLIQTTGDQTYNNAVELGTDTTLKGTNVTFNSILDGAQGREAGLTVNASQITSFGDRVGENNPLAFLTTEASNTTVVNTDKITTTGDQIFGELLILSGSTTLISETKDITLNQVDYNQAGNSNLTIKAGDSIILNGAIADSEPGNDSLNLDFTANTDRDNTGTIKVNGSVNTGGGNISMTNTTGDDVGIDIQNTIDSQGGDINLNGSSESKTGISIESDINSDGGDIAIAGTSQTDNGVFVSGNITSGDGNINITGNTTGTNDDANGIEIQSGAIATTGNGKITLEGTNIETQSSQITSENGAIEITGTSRNEDAIVIDNTNVNSNSDITFTGDEINLISDTASEGDTVTLIEGDTVTLQPQTPDLNITIAPTATPTTDLDITQAELNTIDAKAITIGDATNGSGIITVENPFTIDDPLTLTTSNIIQVDGAIAGTDDASITLNSSLTNLNSDITTQEKFITINSNVILQSNVFIDTTLPNGEVEEVSEANITIQGSINGANDLTLRAGSGDINILGTIGTTENPLGDLQANSKGETNFGDTINARSLTTDANSLTTDFNGTTTLSGDVTTTGNQTFNDNLEIASNINLTASNGNVDTRNIATSGNDLNINANSISTQDIITQGGNVDLRSLQSEISTGDINSSDTTGGNISLNSATTITTEDINSSGTNGDGGNVTLNSNTLNQDSVSLGNIQVNTIRADSATDGNGGVIRVNFDNNNNNQAGLFLAEGSFQLNGDDTSIFTNSSNEEAITIRHGGNGDIIFYVGNNPNLLGEDNPNGTLGVISSRLVPSLERSFLYTTTIEDIRIISVDEPDINLDTDPPPTQVLETLVAQAKLEQSAQNPALIYVSFTPPEIKGLTNDPEENFARRESCLTAEYTKALNLKGPDLEPAICLDAQPSDLLEILVITEEGEPIFIPLDVTRAEVEEQAEKLYREITYREELWQEPAEQLYEWLIGNIEEELETREVDNLLFILPPKLRSLPLAALYDFENNQFLVEKGYNIGLSPSLNLINTTYNEEIQNASVLAFGASNFEATQNQQALNAVEFELSQIVNLRGGREPIVNEQFTLENLQSSLENNSFPIVHLSTHADFDTANIDDIYIQLYNDKLTLEQLRELELKVGGQDLELLVLSACRSTFGDVDAELGFAGLAIKLGVKTAIGSLWKVSDVSTPGLMIEFYNYLKTSPVKAEALRLAQVAMIEQNTKIDLENRQMITSWGEVLELPENIVADLLESDITEDIQEIDFSHPYYWAPFTVIGSPW